MYACWLSQEKTALLFFPAYHTINLFPATRNSQMGIERDFCTVTETCEQENHSLVSQFPI